MNHLKHEPDHLVGRLERAEMVIDLQPTTPAVLRWHSSADHGLRAMIRAGRPLVLWGRSAATGPEAAPDAVRNLHNAALSLWDVAGLNAFGALPSAQALVAAVVTANHEADAAGAEPTRVFVPQSVHPSLLLAISTGPARRAGTDNLALRHLADVVEKSTTLPAGIMMRTGLPAYRFSEGFDAVLVKLHQVGRTNGLWVCDDRRGRLDLS